MRVLGISAYYHDSAAALVCDGEIVRDPRGSAGFGYDSVFEPADGDGRTFAEMTSAEKRAISHRGRAFAALLRRLRECGMRAS